MLANHRTGAAQAGYTSAMATFGAVKVFSATMARDREVLGERISEWLLAHPELELVDRVLTQSSDDEYHCLSITLFLSGDTERYLAEVPQPRRPVVPRPA